MINPMLRNQIVGCSFLNPCTNTLREGEPHLHSNPGLGDGFGYFDFQPLLGDDWTL